MIRNYIKIAWRNLTKNKGFTLINITGLSIGVAACILISVYILHESSYDKHVPNSENIYRLNNTYNDNGVIQRGIHFSANAASTIKEDFDEVENSGRLMENGLFYGAGSNEIRFEDQAMQFHEEGFSYADQSMIQILSIPLNYGDAKTALSEPKSIVISQKMADKYFKGQNPVDKVMYLNGNNDDPRTIKGVMADFPSNSHLHYDFLLTLAGVEFGDGEQTRWFQQNYFTYLVMKPGTDMASFDKKLSTTIIGKYLKPALKNGGFAMWETVEEKAKINTQPLTAINLHSADIDFEASFRNDIKIIWIFGIVAIFILVIASINFINLSTAKSANRAKEVGLRKVVGSNRGHLIGQFLTESVLIALLSFVVGLGLAALLMPSFNNMAGKLLHLPFESQLFLPMLLGMAILVGLLAGLYPSFYLSAFNPINVLKGKLRMGSKSGGLRSSLVVFQFAISIILIVGTLVVNQQLNFFLTSKIGFEKDQVIQIYGTNMLGDKDQTFKAELANIDGVKNVSISDFLPIEGTKRNGNSFTKAGRNGIDETIGGQAWVVDEDYLQTIGIELIDGKNFGKDIASEADQRAAIINESMAAKLGFENPVGEKLSRGTYESDIIGVVKDFHYNNMKNKVEPLAFFYGRSNTITSVKISAANTDNVVASIENKWKEFSPNMAIRYEFMDVSFAKMYDNVSRIKAIFTSFAILAIFVACLGLFALSAYMVEQRNKEMSIRKVLGASFKTIFQLLTKNFLGLILISMVIAIPAAYYLMKEWLMDYEYRIEISWPVFAIAALIAISIALFTVSYHAIKSALVNPVESLRGE